MEKKRKHFWGYTLLVLTIALSAIIITGSLVAKSQLKEKDNWILHSYGNNVALYNGDELIEVFGTISLDTLPNSDKQLLDNGIIFSTKDEAISAIEDYDG